MLSCGMLGNDYKSQTCSIAGALEVVGERWSLLIVRDVFLGLRRFDEIQANLGIARNVLQTRLERLVEQGVLERSLYQERPPRYEYRLTEKGLDLWPIVVSLMQWGDRHAPPAGGPAGRARAPRLRRRASTSTASARSAASALSARESRARPGPGARREHPLRAPRERRARRGLAARAEAAAAPARSAPCARACLDLGLFLGEPARGEQRRARSAPAPRPPRRAAERTARGCRPGTR